MDPPLKDKTVLFTVLLIRYLLQSFGVQLRDKFSHASTPSYLPTVILNGDRFVEISTKRSVRTQINKTRLLPFRGIGPVAVWKQTGELRWDPLTLFWLCNRLISLHKLPSLSFTQSLHFHSSCSKGAIFQRNSSLDVDRNSVSSTLSMFVFVTYRGHATKIHRIHTKMCKIIIVILLKIDCALNQGI